MKYSIDLILSTPSHIYERNAPVNDSQIDSNELNNPTFPGSITNRAAGHYDGLDALQYPLKPFARFGLNTLDATYEWSRLLFHDCTHMAHDFVASKNGSVLDTATLFNNRTCSLAAAENASTTASGGLPFLTVKPFTGGASAWTCSGFLGVAVAVLTLALKENES